MKTHKKTADAADLRKEKGDVEQGEKIVLAT
jgi:hypothetical protein